MTESGWWREFRPDPRTLPQGLLLAAAYALACWAARKISLDQFFLPAGIRLAALIALPPRYWLYIALGEYAYFAQMRLPMVDRYGLDWALLSSAYQLPTAALILKMHYRRGVRSHAGLLSVAAITACTMGVVNLGLVYALWPEPPQSNFFALAFRYALGDYIGILTVAPLACLWAHRREELPWRSGNDAGTLYACLALFTLGALAWLVRDSSVAKMTFQFFMAVPAIALTCLHGWAGAALGVSLLNAFILITAQSTGLPESYDPDTFSMQQIMALAGTALLALGSRITHHYHRYIRKEQHAREVISYARTTQATSELELRRRVLGLRQIGETLDEGLSETVAWLRDRGNHDVAASLLHLSSDHSRRFREEASMVYPTVLEHVGLYLALEAGGIFDTWEKTDRLVRPHLKGDPCHLSLDLQLAAYRSIADAVSLLLGFERGQVQIRARCGQRGRGRGLLVTVAIAGHQHALAATTRTMAIGRLSGRVQTYGGTVHCRQNRIRMSFFESDSC
jgi:integral membrane sensor domain MASE1